MGQRVVSAIVFLLLTISAQVFSQECQDCKKRQVITYDNVVNVQRPSSSVDSLYRYWQYFHIAGGVTDYFRNTDPSRDCIFRRNAAFYTTNDSVTSIKFGAEHANTPPSGEVMGVEGYLVYGVVTEQSCTLRLETAKTRELVKSGVISLPPGFDGQAIGRTVAAFIGPLYSTIIDFEKKKRDEGEPYAIVPTMTLAPVKAKINVNEKTNIDVLFKDCDGAPLKNRHIIFVVDGGTLKSTDLTTDDQGQGTLEFTAGPSPALANVTSVYPFQKPTGDMTTAHVVPATIQIDKPNTSWYVTASFKVENTSGVERKSEYETVSGSSMDDMNIIFDAWVTNMNPVSGQFSALSQTVSDILCIGSFTESSFWHGHSEISAGGVSAMTDDRSFSSTNATSTTAQTPQLTLSIYKNSYSFSINNINAIQTGGENRVRRSVDPFGTRDETTFTPAEATKLLGLSVDNVNRDTTYTISDTAAQSEGSTTTMTQVAQTFSWKDNVCTLNYRRGVKEDSHVTGISTEDSYSTQTFNVTLYLTYTGDPSTSVETPEEGIPWTYALGQNYPNPFNPSTTIRFSVAERSRVRVTVFNLLGQQVAELANEEMNPGNFERTWNANVTSGLYFYRLEAISINNPGRWFVDVKKMILLK